MTDGRRLTLLIPGLWGVGTPAVYAEAVGSVQAPALARLLARAKPGAGIPGGLEAMLCRSFGLQQAPGADLPIAALTRLADGGVSDEYYWLRADPVHLSADRDRVVMVGNELLDIPQHECDQLSVELNALFRSLGGELEALNARRWYLRLNDAPNIKTTPLAAVIGEDVLPHLPSGDGARHWKSLLNETQMMLHASSVNRERAARGAPAVNSLWFWGGGHLPAVTRAPYDAVWTNEALGVGLARWAGVIQHSIPASAEEWLETAQSGRHLAILHGALAAVQLGDVERWRDFVHSVDEHWLAALETAVRSKRLDEVLVVFGDDLCLSLTARNLRRWWRRAKLLGAWTAA